MALVAACHADATAPVAPGFLGGTSNEHEIGLVLNSTGKSLTIFQVGDPTMQEQIALGTSSTVTPTGFAVRGFLAAVPLGDAASVALINLKTSAIQRFFVFPAGNATGSAFFNDTTVIVANLLQNSVGRFTTSQSSDTITHVVAVAPQPTAVVVTSTRALIISSNLDANFNPLGNGVVTAINPSTMQVVGSVSTGGTNTNDGAIGPDGLLYVVNTGDYVSSGSLTIIDPATLQVQATIPNMGVGPGAISIDAHGIAYISGFFFGTIVWNTTTRAFVRGPSNPVCAPLPGGRCRGAFAATTNTAGKLYQAFFGSASKNLAPYVFVYSAGTFALSDSIAVGTGPSALTIRSF
jgi:YVTN family beta-propeller protein